MSDAGPKLLRGLLEVFILESLEQAPKHGYALLKEMTAAFGAEPNRNRLYPLLARLVKDGLIREVSESGGNRTLYALTDAGTDALHAYRRLPGAFRHALRRIWSVETTPTGEGEGAGEGEGEREERRVPVAIAPRASVGELPYPCPDARVHLDKDPSTGALRIELDGCPMGAYEHCPLCPLAKAVAPFKALVFPS